MNTPVVLITGALTGIGRAIALAFAKQGARIVIAGRHDQAGQNLGTGSVSRHDRPHTVEHASN
jgi:NAD(P)-dependent dehydrogenase (short-subunit alcohol dehydrogenase family)